MTEAECIGHAVNGKDTGDWDDWFQPEGHWEVCKPERKESKMYFQLVQLASD